jgi:hypothetical protein
VQIVEDNFIFVFIILFFGYVFYSMFSKQGKGRMLGGTITETATEEIVQKSGMLTTAIRTHVVETKNGDKRVGIEISENAKFGASFKPIKLTKMEAETLIRMLSEAVAKT